MSWFLNIIRLFLRWLTAGCKKRMNNYYIFNKGLVKNYKGECAREFGNVVDEKHMARLLPSAQKWLAHPWTMVGNYMTHPWY